MNIQMMEGLMGAGSNIKLSGTPMNVYRQANAGGDTEKMKRALRYTGECTEKAVQYQERLDEGLKAEAKDERKKSKLEQDASVKKRQEERKRAEEGAGADQIQISEAAKAALKNNKPAEAAEAIASELVIYAPASKVSAAPAETESSVSITV